MSTAPSPAQQPRPVKVERGGVEPAASKAAGTRWLILLLWLIIGVLTIVQTALVGYQVATSNRALSSTSFANEWYDRLCFMLFTSSWTLFYFVLQWAFSVYISLVFTFMTWIFWIVAASLWQLIYNNSPLRTSGCTLRRCSRLSAVNVIGWTEVAFTSLLLFAVIAHCFADRRGLSLHRRGVRSLYWI